MTLPLTRHPRANATPPSRQGRRRDGARLRHRFLHPLDATVEPVAVRAGDAAVAESGAHPEPVDHTVQGAAGVPEHDELNERGRLSGAG
jgi:hypothetical protein